jgi:hypothetical protein
VEDRPQDFVIRGDLVASNGKAVVIASIWPNHAVASTPGTVAQMQQLDTVVTASSRYRIRIPAASVAADHLSPDGSIDFRLVISDGNSAQIQEITARPGLPANVESVNLGTRPLSTAERNPAEAAQPVTFDAAHLVPGLTRSAVEAAPPNADVTRFARPARTQVSVDGELAGALPAVPTLGCYVVSGAQHGPYNETFTRVYGTASVKGSVDQQAGSSHTISVAVKGLGAWGASGTKTVSTTAGWYTDFVIVDAAVYNKVYQQYFYTKCNTSGSWETVATQSKPTTFHSGPYFYHTPHANYTNCTTGYQGTTYTRSSNRQGAIVGGMDLPFIKVSAQSGWDAATLIQYRFFSPGRICGSNAMWQQAAFISATA